MAEHHVLGDGEDGDEHEVLVHHADAGVHRVAGAGEVLHDVVEQDLALVGLVQAVEHVHQRRLARAVLAEQAVDLAGLDGEVDVIVGDEGAEPLGDAAEFELHGDQSSRAAPLTVGLPSGVQVLALRALSEPGRPARAGLPGACCAAG